VSIKKFYKDKFSGSLELYFVKVICAMYLVNGRIDILLPLIAITSYLRICYILIRLKYPIIFKSVQRFMGKRT